MVARFTVFHLGMVYMISIYARHKVIRGKLMLILLAEVLTLKVEGKAKYEVGSIPTITAVVY